MIFWIINGKKNYKQINHHSACKKLLLYNSEYIDLKWLVMNYRFNYFVDQFSHSVWPFFLKLKGKVFLCSGSWKKVFWAMLVTKPFWWPLTFTMGHTETFLKICLYGLQREKILLDQCLLFLTTICRCLTIRQWLKTWAPTKPRILSKPRQHVKRANLVDSLYP